jgi:hypothetical protein
VIISMSGLVRNINEAAARGARLNCVGIAVQELIAVWERRRRLLRSFELPRASTSTRAMFLRA